jgi:hypothetical protein
MKPLPANRPDLWSQSQRACTLRVSRAELEQRLGPALVHDEGDGLGPRYRWGFQCDCGLELVIDLPRTPQAREAVMWMEHLEVEHALAHLSMSINRVLWRADMQDPLPLDGWAVVRRDAPGNRFDLCVLPVRAHAECLARLIETRAHGYYNVEPRGTPPLPMRPAHEQGYFAEPIAS